MSLEYFDFSEIEQMMKSIWGDHKISFVDTVKDLISGDVEFTGKLLWDIIKDQLFYEMDTSKRGLIHILILAIIAAIFANFSGVFKSTQVAEISFTVIYMLLITICLNNFRVLIESATGHLERLSGFMEVLGPLYFLAVSIATGNMTSVSFYQIVLFLLYLIEVLVLNFLLPLTQIYLVVSILSELSSEVKLTKFAELINLIVTWSLKTLCAGIIGWNVIQRILSPAIDAVKRGMIPIMGDVVGGATEVVIGTAVLIKNGIGVAGMLICLVICLTPVIQMSVTVLMYQILTALIQPISDKRMVSCIESMADGCKMILKIVLTSGVLFMLTIAVVATTSGGV